MPIADKSTDATLETGNQSCSANLFDCAYSAGTKAVETINEHPIATGVGVTALAVGALYFTHGKGAGKVLEKASITAKNELKTLANANLADDIPLLYRNTNYWSHQQLPEVQTLAKNGAKTLSPDGLSDDIPLLYQNLLRGQWF